MKKLEENTLPSISITLGYLIIKDYEYLTTKVETLYKLGYGIKHIATICFVNIDDVKKILKEKDIRK